MTFMAPPCLGHCKAQMPSLPRSSFLAGHQPRLQAYRPARQAAECRVLPVVNEGSGDDKFRLHNLAPQKGATRKAKRVGRGVSAGQGRYGGRGQAGQKSRSGGGTRPGFEGGQTPLYRRLPKLRGIAGGMHKGLPKYVNVNLGALSEFPESQEVSLDSLRESKHLKVSGRDKSLPLKVLAGGTLTRPLKFRAQAFSESAKAAIEAAGGSVEQVPAPRKWTRGLGRKREAAREALKAEGKKVEGRIPRKLKKGILRKAAKRDPKPKPDGRTAAAKAKASKKGKTFKA